MASNNIEDLSAFFPIDNVGLCPPETIIVPVVGILLALALGKFALKIFKRPSCSEAMTHANKTRCQALSCICQALTVTPRW